MNGASVAGPDCVFSRHYLISELLFPGSLSCLFAACVTCVRQQLLALMLSVHLLLPISHKASVCISTNPMRPWSTSISVPKHLYMSVTSLKELPGLYVKSIDPVD